MPMMYPLSTDICLLDQSEDVPSLRMIYAGLTRKLLCRNIESKVRNFWHQHPLLPVDTVHEKILSAINGGHPLAVGRLGGVEATILLWREQLATINFLLRSSFFDTRYGATNAGIRPRNKSSYSTFAALLRQSLDSLDVQGVWMTDAEALCQTRPVVPDFVAGESLGPSASSYHWLHGLAGKKVLVVSPFATSISTQLPALSEIWPDSTWHFGANFVIQCYPYLVDDNCPETWWEVYNRVGDTVLRGDYDVALFGCGGLGLPFAVLAKHAGRVGIHLGGHLQLVFGIYGSRHLGQSWFANVINSYWVRPRRDEIPSSASRIESSCYW